MSLEAELAAAHAAGDGAALARIYSDAAQRAGDVDTACFLLTHAYVHALEAGDDRAAALKAQLVAAGREPA